MNDGESLEEEFVLSTVQLRPSVLSQAGQHIVLSLNKSFSHFQSVPTVFVFCNGPQDVSSSQMFVFFASCFISDLEVYRVRSGLLILGSSQLSSQTIFGVLYFPSFYHSSLVTSGYRAWGPLRFKSFPQGPSSAFLKDSPQILPESSSSTAVLCGKLTSSKVCTLTLIRLGCKLFGYFSSVGDLVRKTYLLLQKNQKYVDFFQGKNGRKLL